MKLPAAQLWLFPALLAALLLLALASLSLGVVPVSQEKLWTAAGQWLQGQSPDSMEWRIITQIRLPRLVMAATTGAVLAWCGLIFQTLLRNPLASPSVIGVSNGSALGAVAGMLLVGQAAWTRAWLVPWLSLAGGLAVIMIILHLERRSRHNQSLLLNGISIGLLCSALTTGLLFFAHERLEAIVFWMMGGLWQSTWSSALTMTAVLVVQGVVLLVLAPSMNVLLLGDQTARDLGLDARRTRRWLFTVVAIAIAIGVSLTGTIGFIGLIVPHILRLMLGNDHRRLLPAVASGGALLLVTADLLARTLAAPAEIPVGVFTAILGAPVFIWLLQNGTWARRKS